MSKAGVTGRTRRRRSLAALALAGMLLSGPAAAQQVLVCFTLHNDLTNFDRRAQMVDPSWAEIKAAQERAEEAIADYKAICIDQTLQPAETCDRLSARAWEKRQDVEVLMTDYIRSPIGGADPVRLNIIRDMHRNGCLRGPSFQSAEGAPVRIPPPKTPIRVKG